MAETQPAASVFADKQELGRESNKKAYRDLTSQNKSKKNIKKGFLKFDQADLPFDLSLINPLIYRVDKTLNNSRF